MEISTRILTFEEILPFWKQLWYPKEDIQKRSGKLLMNGFNRSIITDDNIKVTFFGAEVDGKIVGVNSGYSPNGFGYRSRGLFVLPEYRGRGIAQELFQATKLKADEGNYVILWSIPRKTALNAYKRFGFKVMSKFFEGEYGLNCFVVKGLIKWI